MKQGKTLGKALAIVLSCTVACTGVGVLAYAVGAQSKGENTAQSSSQAASPQKHEAIAKDETVYVLAGADGAAKKIIVSDWIKNVAKDTTVRDKSELQNVQNVKGDESYTMNGNNMRVWDAQGNDLYYQGDIRKELPVELSVRYELDGKPISPQDLAGKSGKVTIQFCYKNNQSQMVTIDGKQENIYVPFVMLTGLMLDNDHFRNIQVSNGKLLNDGDRTVIAGFALPGLGENLKLDKEKWTIPDSVEITADAQDFELMTTVTIATNEVFSDLDLSQVDSLDDLSKAMEQLTGAMDQLMDGSSKLYGGLTTLVSKSGELIAGIDQLAAGSKQLADGAGSLDSGAADLQAGVKKIAEGLGTLSSNSQTLNAGAKQVFESLLSAADTQLAAAGIKAQKLTIDNYGKVLDGVLSSLDETAVRKLAEQTARKQVEAAVKAKQDEIKAQVTAAVQDQVLEGVLAAVGKPMTAKEYQAAVQAGLIPQAVQQQVSAAVEQQMASGDIQTKISAATQQQMNALIEQNMKSEQVTSQINEAVQKAKAGAASIQALKTQLDSYKQFYQGLRTYTAGVDQAGSGAGELKAGTDTLKKGTSDLKNGADNLNTGVGSLQEGSGALVNGVKQLQSGAMQLDSGLKEFNEQGVKKLSDAVNGDVNSLLTRLRATCDVSRSYKSFSGISDEMDGQVKFIYRTDSIKQ